MLGWLRRRLDANPILRHEAGWVEGRPWWKSPATLLLAGGALLLVTEVTITLWRWASWSRIRLTSIPDAVIEARRLTPEFLNWIGMFNIGLAAILLIAPFWLSARSWARDRDPSVREELAVTPLTPEAILWAKAKFWLYLWAASLLTVIFMRGLLMLPGWHSAPEFSLLWFLSSGLDDPLRDVIGQLNAHSWYDLIRAMTPLMRDRLLFPLRLFGTGAFLIGVIARASLRQWNPSLSVIAALLGALILLLISAGSKVRPSFYHLLWYFHDATHVMCVAAPFVWIGLTRRVARAYEMER